MVAFRNLQNTGDVQQLSANASGVPDYTSPAKCPGATGRTNPLTSGDLPDLFVFSGAPPTYKGFAPSDDFIDLDAFCATDAAPVTDHAYGKVLMKDSKTGLCQVCEEAKCVIWMANSEGQQTQECTGVVPLTREGAFHLSFPMPGSEIAAGWGTEAYPHIHLRCEGCGGLLYNQWMPVATPDYCSVNDDVSRAISAPDASNSMNSARIGRGDAGLFHVIMTEDWEMRGPSEDPDACWSTQWANPCGVYADRAAGADCSCVPGPPEEPEGALVEYVKATVPSTAFLTPFAPPKPLHNDDSSSNFLPVIISVAIVALIIVPLSIVLSFRIWVRSSDSSSTSIKPSAALVREFTEDDNEGLVGQASGFSRAQQSTTRCSSSIACGSGSTQVKEARALPSLLNSPQSKSLYLPPTNFLALTSSSAALLSPTDLHANSGMQSSSEFDPSRALPAPRSIWGAPPHSGSCHAAAPSSEAALLQELDCMVGTQPPILFAGHYLIIGERAKGSQALIQFARSHDGGYSQYAIKFFSCLKEFYSETALYEDPVIRSTLPAIFSASANFATAGGEGGPVQRTGPSGFIFPPHIIVERGTTLAAWRSAQERHMYSVLNMFVDLAKHLERLHQARHVHRDLKPGNVLLMLQSQSWKLIDYGISGRSGEQHSPSCTLPYASPEVVQAYAAQEPVTVHPSHDTWALGVMMYECLCNEILFPAFTKREVIFEHAAGERRYPWEDPDFWPAAFHDVPTRVRGAVLQCLARNPDERPAAWELVLRIGRLGNTSDLANM